MNFSEARRRLVENLKREGIIRSLEVEAAMLEVPRELFVWPGYEEDAYADAPLPLGSTGQTISAPHMVAIMLEELRLKPGHVVLEVGSGSGYNAALIAEIVKPGGRVVTVERVPELADFARGNLERAGYEAPLVKVVLGDGSLGYPPREHREIYDRIVVAAAAPRVPEPLLAQLKKEGVLLVPIGPPGYQDLLRVAKTKSGGILEEHLGGCVFVPLMGEYGYS